MLRVNNKTISFAKGENITFSIEVRDADGVPFIFPEGNKEEYTYEVIFSVVNEYGNKVIEKIMDMKGPIVYMGVDGPVIDNSEFGYAKFVNQEIVSTDNVNNFYGYSKGANGNTVIPDASQLSNRLKIAKMGNNYYCWCQEGADGQPVIYKFNLALSLVNQDTINLRVKEYKYDFIAYIKQGDEILWQRQLIQPSSLILEDSNT